MNTRTMLLTVAAAALALAACDPDAATAPTQPSASPSEAVAPGRVNDLVAVAAGSTTLTAQWTQVNDVAGDPAWYRLRYSTPPFDWYTANVGCESTVRGDKIGAPLSCTITGLSPGTRYDFQVISFRSRNGRWRSAEFSNIATGVTLGTTGFVQIAVVGLEAGVGAGGTATVTGSLVSSPIVVTVPTPPSTPIGLSAGSYRISYAPPVGYLLAPGALAVIDVQVQTGQTTTVSFSVLREPTSEPPPSPTGGEVFYSDWSSGTGRSLFALTDASKSDPWTVQVHLDWSDVISAAGLGFPTTNVLRVAGQDGQTSAEMLQYTSVPVPAVGESIYYRWYFRFVAPVGSQNTHPIQDGPFVGAANWMLNNGSITATTYKADIQSLGTAWPNNRWGLNLTFSKGATYRWEMQVVRVSTTTYRMHVRVYDSAGTLLYGDADFRNVDGSAHLGQNPVLTFNDVSQLNGLRAGVNGFTGISGYQIHSYQGGFCVRTEGWCGPYTDR